jgi:hypothetical protein
MKLYLREAVRLDNAEAARNISHVAIAVSAGMSCETKAMEREIERLDAT